MEKRIESYKTRILYTLRAFLQLFGNARTIYINPNNWLSKSKGMTISEILRSIFRVALLLFAFCVFMGVMTLHLFFSYSFSRATSLTIKPIWICPNLRLNTMPVRYHYMWMALCLFLFFDWLSFYVSQYNLVNCAMDVFDACCLALGFCNIMPSNSGKIAEKIGRPKNTHIACKAVFNCSLLLSRSPSRSLYFWNISMQYDFGVDNAYPIQYRELNFSLKKAPPRKPRVRNKILKCNFMSPFEYK